MKFPQALADEKSRSVLLIFTDQVDFDRNWADKVKTIDAHGILTHPSLIKIGDTIDFFITGWNKAKVENVKFTPKALNLDNFHKVGDFQFEMEGGSFMNVFADGRDTNIKLYKF